MIEAAGSQKQNESIHTADTKLGSSPLANQGRALTTLFLV